MPIVTTSRAERPAKSFSGKPFPSDLPSAKPRARHLLEKALQQRGHAAQPQGKHDHDVFGPRDGLLSVDQARRQHALLPLGLAAKQGKVERADSHAAHLVARSLGPFHIGIGQRVAEVGPRPVGVSLHDEQALCAGASVHLLEPRHARMRRP
jgi:hypothetical protein